MAARNRITYAPLDVDSARAALAADKLVRVGIVPTGYFPDGGSGRLRSVGDPAVDGEEFIQVEVNIGGSKDVIPFAPSDLTPIKRGQTSPDPITAPKTTRVAAPRAKSARPASIVSNVESLDARRADSRTASSPVATPIEAAAPAKPATADSAPAIAKPAPKKPAPRGKRAPVTITISTTGVENTGWQVEARLGAKVMVKAAAVSPARAAQLVATLDNAALTEFVADVLAEHRAQAQARADRLAQELAAVQAELAEYSGK